MGQQAWSLPERESGACLLVVPVALTGGVDEVSEDGQGAHAVPLVTVLHFL